MAKSKNHTAHNQSYKAHKNGIKKPKGHRQTSTKGVRASLSMLACLTILDLNFKSSLSLERYYIHYVGLFSSANAVDFFHGLMLSVLGDAYLSYFSKYVAFGAPKLALLTVLLFLTKCCTVFLYSLINYPEENFVTAP